MSGGRLTGMRSKSTARAGGRRTSLSKGGDMGANKNVPHMPVYQGYLPLNDPTSVRMQSSFLIKNQNTANFD